MPNSSIFVADVIYFSTVAEKPQFEPHKELTIVIASFAILIVGLLINRRIFNILAKRSNAAAMDQLLKFNNIINLALYPIILAYYMLSHLVLPVSDYIGVVGCILTVHLLDAFARFYSFTFPVAVALLRYLFVVEHLKVKAHGELQTETFFRLYYSQLWQNPIWTNKFKSQKIIRIARIVIWNQV